MTPRQIGAACDAATRYLAHGDYDRALRALPTLSSRGDSPGASDNFAGVALLLKGEPAEALGAFRKALEHDPTLEEARLNAGIALMRLGRDDDAASEFQKVFADRSSTRRAVAAWHHALVSDRAGNPAGALRWLERAIELDPSFDTAMLYRGVIHEQQGNLEHAARSYLEYLELRPDSVIAHLRFGIVAHRAGQRDLARQYLRSVVRHSPESVEAMEARKFLVVWE